MQALWDAREQLMLELQVTMLRLLPRTIPIACAMSFLRMLFFTDSAASDMPVKAAINGFGRIGR